MIVYEGISKSSFRQKLFELSHVFIIEMIDGVFYIEKDGSRLTGKRSYIDRQEVAIYLNIEDLRVVVEDINGRLVSNFVIYS